MQLPHVSFDKMKNDIVLRYQTLHSVPLSYSCSYRPYHMSGCRYFTPSQALEFRIPAVELRVRDPLTGSLSCP